jgi:hypothetical protein
MSLILSGTDGLSDVDGSASTPAIRGTDTNTGIFFPAADTIAFAEGGAEVARFDSSGNLGIATTNPLEKLDVRSANASFGSTSGTDGNIYVQSGYDAGIRYLTRLRTDFNGFFSISTGSGSNSVAPSSNTVTERMRIDSVGRLLVGTTSSDDTNNGLRYFPGTGANTETVLAVTNQRNDTGGETFIVNRQNTDGTLIQFRQANTPEGGISVSGTTVSYNGGHLSRYAQTLVPKDDSLLKGTVLSNLDEMNTYVDAKDNAVENEQLNKVKVSDVEGDANVAGVFVNWSHDTPHDVDEINMAMTGDMIIRIAEGVTVQRGDLLMSAGDGTAKPQGDDIVRSKTVAKVTSTHVTCTYADGSYCVPCVLMAC